MQIIYKGKRIFLMVPVRKERYFIW